MIVIFGVNGMLGSTLMKYIQERTNLKCIGYTRNDLDAANTSELFNQLETLKKRDHWISNTYIVNAIGMIPQKQPDNMSYVRVNTLFPHYLQFYCEKIGATLIHVTTDCVYTGQYPLGYAENEAHDEKSIYGVTKSSGEPSNAMIIRTSIIGEEIAGKKSLLEWVRSQKGETIKGFTNHYWNGLTCLQLAKVIDQLIQNRVVWKGVKHIISQPLSKFELVGHINRVYGLNCNIVPFETEQAVNRVLLPSQDAFVRSIVIPSVADQIQELHMFHHQAAAL